MGPIQHWFLHVDLDAFFASVEQLDHPEYRGKPVIVGGKPEDRRSVVSTASYEARKFGVHSAMPTAQAYKLCPQGIFVYGRMERYSQLSYCIMEILKNYSPDVDQMSIDEAFLDITGTEKLFGKPEEVAMKIKKEIKEKTGLTVSVGIAQSKYHAKIASDMRKPDGLFMVQPGTEQEFMLSLPLKKIFGLGTKSQEKLNNCGIKTTQDIFDKPLSTLKFMCGENQGQFLYDVVRGKFDDDRFGKEAKSHSISAETTFPYDVNDGYTLETVILNLAYSIMFRLLKEKSFSRTAMVKIRYEDFSTVSIQQTFDKNISTLDNFYEILKNLFQRKWEKNRGVRLLGVGLENIEKEDRPSQQELFDDGSEKKQKVEKAILNMSQKHPELKVHKARMLQSINNGFKAVFIAFVLVCTAGAKNLYAQTPEEKDSLFKYEIDGSYEAGFAGNLNSSFGNGTEFVISPSTPVFKQNIDLAGDFSFGSDWLFSINFADNFNKNTYSITYTGKNYLKKFQFSNRDIIFPQTYMSLESGYNPGGGNNEAPGILFNWQDKENQKFFADAILRYDMTKSASATFYGKNKVTDTKTDAASYVKNRYFTIPSQNIITQIADIYVSTKTKASANITQNGITYKKLDASEYLISANKCFLVISDRAFDSTSDEVNKILVTFTTPQAITDLKLILGDYNNPSSYLGQIQQWFQTSQPQLSLQAYSYNLETTFNGIPAIILQNDKGFSPFLISSAYNIGTDTNNDISIINSITEEKLTDYSAITSGQDFTQLADDFFKETSNNILIYRKDQASTDFTLPENRYPFASQSPYIYLTGNNQQGFAVLKRSYSAVSYFDIGKNLDNNSIAVYINGLPVKDFTYSSTSGYVNINQKISDADRIDITWREQAATIDNGTVTTGAGFSYTFTPDFTADVNLTAKIPFTPYSKYSTKNTSHASYAALSSSIKYEKDNLVLKDTAAIAVENTNTTSCYVVSENSGSGNQTSYHSQNCFYDTKVVPQIKVLPGITVDNKGSLQSSKGILDTEISGYKLPLNWDFTDSQNWASMDIKLAVSNTLNTCNKLELAIKNESPESLTGYRIFLQLGITADNTEQNLEEYFPVWEITDLLDLSAASLNAWQVVEINISEEQQAFLINEKNIRIIVYKDSALTTCQTGKLSVGPYQLNKEGIYTNHSDKLQVSSTVVTATAAPAIKKYYSSKAYNDAILWNTQDTLLSEEDAVVSAITFFSPSQFSDYGKVNFDFAFTSKQNQTHSPSTKPGLTLILDNASSNETALQLEINQSALESLILQSDAITDATEYHTITIEIQSKTVYIDSVKLSPSEYSLAVNPLVVPSRQTVQLNVIQNGTLITKGKFINGTLYYTETNYKLNLQNIFEASYTKDTIFATEENQILYNGFINIKSQQLENIPLSPSKNTTPYGDLLLKTGASFFKTDFSIHGLMSLSKTKGFSLDNTGYIIKTNAPLFNFITFEETFNYDQQNLQIKKEDSLSLDFLPYSVPLNMSFKTTAEQQSQKYKQNYSTQLGFEVPAGKTKFTSKTNFALTQKQTADSNITQLPDAFNSWTNSLLLQFSQGDINAEQRTSYFATSLIYKINNYFIPQLSYSLTGSTDTNQLQTHSAATALNLSVPFKINNNSFSFTYSKKAVSTRENTTLNNYTDDLSSLFGQQAQISWFYTAIPFYELFDFQQPQKLQETAGVSNSYNSKYEFTWKRPLSASVKDLYIPIGFTTSVTRDTITSSNSNDIYQIKASVNHMFINMLGSKGKLKLFNWFAQDEFTSVLSTQVKIPSSGTNVTWNVTYAEALLCYLDNKNTLKTSFDLSISGTNNWMLKFGGMWTHSGKTSLVLSLKDYFMDKSKDPVREVIFKENFSIAFGKVNSVAKQEYKYTHTTVTNIGKQFSVDTSLGTTFLYTQDKALNLNLEYSVGAKITF